MLTGLIYLVVLLLVIGVVWWITTQIPLPEPMPMILRVVFALLALLVLVNFLLGLVGHGVPMRL